MHVYMCTCQVSVRPEEATGSPGAGIRQLSVAEWVLSTGPV